MREATLKYLIKRDKIGAPSTKGILANAAIKVLDMVFVTGFIFGALGADLWLTAGSLVAYTALHLGRSFYEAHHGVCSQCGSSNRVGSVLLHGHVNPRRTDNYGS